jgi:DHA3 family tetracycline resistance protein-like MFS transporter
MNITKTYYLFVLSKDFGLAFTFASFVPYLLWLGLSYSEVAFINMVFAGVVFLGELPTGMFADSRSRVWSLRAGVWLWIIGSVFYALAQGVWTAALADGIFAIGNAFLSGARQAWITDALKKHGREKELRHVFGTTAMLSGIACVIGGALGVLLSSIHMRLIWPPLILGCLVSLYIAYVHMKDDGEPAERVSEWEALKRSVKLLRQSHALSWILIILVVTGGFMTFNHYWSPLAQSLWGRGSLTWIWPLLYGSAALAGYLVRKHEHLERYGSSWIVTMLFCAGGSLALVYFVPMPFWILGMMMVHELSRGVLGPLMDTYVQKRVESSYRATFGSLQSFIAHFGFTLAPAIVWISLDGEPDTPNTILRLWFITGGGMAVVALVLWLLRPRKDMIAIKDP